IRALQGSGLTLAVIARIFAGELDRGDADLAAAVAVAQIGDDGNGLRLGDDAVGLVPTNGFEEIMTLEQLAERSGMPAALLRAAERAGLTMGRRIDGEERYPSADVEMVRSGLRLLEAGLPLGALLDLAATYTRAARETAEQAVELFDEHIRKPIKAAGL